MSHMPNDELEGRLNAQRETLGFLIAHLESRSGPAGGLLDALDTHSRFQDHQEDPGAVPVGGAFAIEGAMMRELRLILEEARARLSELRQDGRSV